jgi:hypothetical protein
MIAAREAVQFVEHLITDTARKKYIFPDALT